ncbi:hypothetical protein CHCC5027_3526 [Bacillus paralicheniformis]|nr:hypothetical protein CHCC5027_3526 [Bacillus paralicheniformis]
MDASNTSQNDSGKTKETTENKTKEEAKKPAEKKKEASKAKDTKLGAGTFYVGEDINEGRYIVSTQQTTANFMVYEKNGMLATNEVIGTEKSIAVNNLTVELKDGQKIEIKGANEVQFKVK